MFRRLLSALLLTALPLANGCYDSHFGQAGEAPGEGSPNASLADIRARLRASLSSSRATSAWLAA